ncbi:unnamed protein product [Rotaria sp. Silwood1]|nr:unnamed protein product [Rotaria sp. Silwood1]
MNIPFDHITKSKVQSLNFTISVCNNTNKRQNFTNQTNTVSQSDKIVIVSHFNESLDWLNLLDDEQIPYIVYTRLPKPLAHHLAFVHGHRTSYHQENPSDIVIALRALQWHKYNFMPLSSRNSHYTFKENSSDLQERINYELWKDVLQKELGPSPENRIVTHCCATFAVKREAILAHPAIFYSNILDYIIYKY